MEEQSRRFACDRCRGQKLRCERIGDTGTPCKRCQRARTECVASVAGLNSSSHNEKRSTEGSDKRRRRSRAGPGPTTSFVFTTPSSIETTASSTYPSLGPTEFSVGNGEYLQNGPERALPLDYQAASLDGQHQAVLDRWRNMSAVPPVPVSTFPVESSNGSIPAPSTAYQEGDHLTNPPSSINAFDFDPFFTTNGSSGSTGFTEPMTSEDSMDFAINSYDIAEGRKEECLQQLSDLSAKLLQDLKKINAGDSANSSKDANNESILPAAPSSPLHNERLNVGRMLEHSEKFLEILQHVGGSTAVEVDASNPSPAASNVRYYELNDDDSTQPFGVTSRTTLSQLLGDGFASPQVQYPSAPTPAPTSTPKPSAGLIQPDIPTMLAILTCYTCLIRIYDGVFGNIHKSLLASPAARRKLLPPLPGLHLCGFKLEQHHNLQLEILARVSLHMLARFEKVLDEIRRSCVNSGEGMSASLMTMIIKQGLDGGGKTGQSSEEGSLRDITNSIKRLLEVNLAVA